MKAKFAVAVLTLAFAASSVFAAEEAKKEASPAQKAQQEKMKACNADAKEKNVKGEERKKFMSGCLGGSNACTVDATEKKLVGAAKNSFIKKCEADGKAPAAAEAAKPAK